MSYMLRDVDRLKAQIASAIPDATIEDWRDFGWAVDVSIGERHCVACQPARDDIGQPEIFRSVEEIKGLLSLQ